MSDHSENIALPTYSPNAGPDRTGGNPTPLPSQFYNPKPDPSNATHFMIPMPQQQPQHPGLAVSVAAGQAPQQQVVYVPVPAVLPAGSSQLGANPTPLALLKKTPMSVQCKSCWHRSVTRTKHVVGGYNHAFAWTFFFTTAILFWVPYVVDDWKNVNHCCGNCGVLLATYHRSGRTDVYQ